MAERAGSYEAEYQTKYPLRFFWQTERQSERKINIREPVILSDFKLTGSLILKSVMVIFLVVYLGRLYVSDYAADVSMDKISAALEQVSGVTDLSEPGVSGLRRFYQIDENDIDSYFFRKAALPDVCRRSSGS